ncbi:MAG TPA: 6,7-dimethyl-8-ribityllumazine synthase [Alphaproteobacteria bacterium]|nr:6,7-dimethyl-8-ribityllumazine synthase [Alphaproteobacteria bacterium]
MSEHPQIMIVEARFYEDIADELVRGAAAALGAAGATFERYAVPGVFEIPSAIQMAIRSLDFTTLRGRFDGYVVLGCVIRGETSHYDIVAEQSARAIQDLVMKYTLALGFGIVTAENREQAWARSSVDDRNRGGAAARACLQMLDVKRQLLLFPR